MADNLSEKECAKLKRRLGKKKKYIYIYIYWCSLSKHRPQIVHLVLFTTEETEFQRGLPKATSKETAQVGLKIRLLAPRSLF